jgi:hypothetical protein
VTIGAGLTPYCGAVADRLNRDDVARILNRAQAIEHAGDAEMSDGIDSETLIEAAAEVGIDRNAVRAAGNRACRAALSARSARWTTRHRHRAGTAGHGSGCDCGHRSVAHVGAQAAVRPPLGVNVARSTSVGCFGALRAVPHQRAWRWSAWHCGFARHRGGSADPWFDTGATANARSSPRRSFRTAKYSVGGRFSCGSCRGRGRGNSACGERIDTRAAAGVAAVNRWRILRCPVWAQPWRPARARAGTVAVAGRAGREAGRHAWSRRSPGAPSGAAFVELSVSLGRLAWVS